MLLILVVLAGCVATDDGRPRRSRPCDQGENCLDWQSFEVVFTNPECKTYEYDQPVSTVDGSEFLTEKPQNVYCSREDSELSGSRPESPQSRLIEWIEQTGEGDELFVAALSFSDRLVFDALCETEADVTLVLDKKSALARQLDEECGKEVLIRGHQKGVDFAHVKLFMLNPNGAGPADGEEEQFLRMAYGSGNLSSGTHLHHENWHFVEVNRDSYFVEAHRCLMNALIDEDATFGKAAFRNAILGCTDAIEFPEEDDIRAYFIPHLEHRKEIARRMVDGVTAADRVDIAAHRFSHGRLIGALEARLLDDEDFTVRMVADDDLYWLNPLIGASKVIGPNSLIEGDRINRLEAADGEEDDGDIDRFSTGAFQIRYMETRSPLLHHNKFIVYHGHPQGDAVLCGAANLTGTGFTSNLENIYWVTIPHVVQAYVEQFEQFYGAQPRQKRGPTPKATPPEKMPVENITVD